MYYKSFLPPTCREKIRALWVFFLLKDILVLGLHLLQKVSEAGKVSFVFPWALASSAYFSNSYPRKESLRDQILYKDFRPSSLLTGKDSKQEMDSESKAEK